MTVAIAVAVTPAMIDTGAGRSSYLLENASREHDCYLASGASAPANLAHGHRLAPLAAIEVDAASGPWWVWGDPNEAATLLATRLSIYAGPPQAIEDIDVSSDDYVRAGGFILEVGGAGAVAYSTIADPMTTRIETFAAAGQVQVGSVPVLLGAVYSAGTTATALKAGLI